MITVPDGFAGASTGAVIISALHEQRGKERHCNDPCCTMLSKADAKVNEQSDEGEVDEKEFEDVLFWTKIPRSDQGAPGQGSILDARIAPP